MKTLIPALGLLALLTPSLALAIGGATPSGSTHLPDLRMSASSAVVSPQASAARAEDCERYVRSGRIRMSTRPSEQKATLAKCIGNSVDVAAAGKAAATSEPTATLATSKAKRPASAAPGTVAREIGKAPQSGAAEVVDATNPPAKSSDSLEQLGKQSQGRDQGLHQKR